VQHGIDAINMISMANRLVQEGEKSPGSPTAQRQYQFSFCARRSVCEPPETHEMGNVGAQEPDASTMMHLHRHPRAEVGGCVGRQDRSGCFGAAVTRKRADGPATNHLFTLTRLVVGPITR
jgi:hypothetical protein